MSLGLPIGQLDERLRQACAKVSAAAARNNIAAGIDVASLDYVPVYRELGYSLLTHGLDTGYLLDGGQQLSAALRQACGGRNEPALAMPVRLSDAEDAMLRGAVSPGASMAMKVLVAFCDAVGAKSLLPIVGAHVDGCLYHGEAGLDFVEALLEGAPGRRADHAQCRIARPHPSRADAPQR